MSRLSQAMAQICVPMTVDELATILDVPRTTAGRWLKSLRDDQDFSTWSAAAVEALATYESRQLGTTLIIDALRPVEEAKGEPSPREVRHQIEKADRKNSSLKLELDDIEAHGVFDRERARAVLGKTEAVMHEVAGQQNILKRWRNVLVKRLNSR